MNGRERGGDTGDDGTGWAKLRLDVALARARLAEASGKAARRRAQADVDAAEAALRDWAEQTS